MQSSARAVVGHGTPENARKSENARAFMIASMARASLDA
jgi:hypothetical protein